MLIFYCKYVLKRVFISVSGRSIFIVLGGNIIYYIVIFCYYVLVLFCCLEDINKMLFLNVLFCFFFKEFSLLVFIFLNCWNWFEYVINFAVV